MHTARTHARTHTCTCAHAHEHTNGTRAAQSRASVCDLSTVGLFPASLAVRACHISHPCRSQLHPWSVPRGGLEAPQSPRRIPIAVWLLSMLHRCGDTRRSSTAVNAAPAPRGIQVGKGAAAAGRRPLRRQCGGGGGGGRGGGREFAQEKKELQDKVAEAKDNICHRAQACFDAAPSPLVLSCGGRANFARVPVGGGARAGTGGGGRTMNSSERAAARDGVDGETLRARSIPYLKRAALAPRSVLESERAKCRTLCSSSCAAPSGRLASGRADGGCPPPR